MYSISPKIFWLYISVSDHVENFLDTLDSHLLAKLSDHNKSTYMYTARTSRRYQFVARTIPNCEGVVYFLFWQRRLVRAVYMSIVGADYMLLENSRRYLTLAAHTIISWKYYYILL